MVFAHGFGHDGIQSIVLDALACIYMYCNIETNIMKNQSGSPSFGIQGKSLYICVSCVMLSLRLFSVFYNSYVRNFYTGLKPTFGARVFLASRGRLCCSGVSLRLVVDPVQRQISGIDSGGEIR